MFQSINTKITVITKRTISLYFVVFGFFAPGLSFLCAQQKYFRYYTTDDGLPGNTIPAGDSKRPIFQDKDGFMWFASFSGISIYDGNKFNNYSTVNGGLTDDIVFNFFQKSGNEVWVVETAAVDVYVNRKKVRSIPLRGYLLSNFLSTRDGRIVVVATDRSVYEIREYSPVRITTLPEQIQATSTHLNEVGDHVLISDLNTDSLYLVDKSFKKIVDRQKGQIFRDDVNRYWYFNPIAIGSQFYLLDTLALQTGIFKLLPAPDPMNKVNLKGKCLVDFLPDMDGYYWMIIDGEKGVTRIDGDGHSLHFDINARSLMEDADRNIWMPEDAGFTKFYNKYCDFYREPEGLSSAYITGITEDERNGAAWLAQSNSISCIYQHKIYNFPYPDTIHGWTNIQVQNDSLWLTDSRLYLYKIDYDPQPNLQFLKQWIPDINDYKFRKQPVSDFISCFQDYRDGSMFFTKENQGLFRASMDGSLQKLYGPGVFSFCIDGNELWTGGGLLDTGIRRWKIIPDKEGVHIQLIQRFKDLPGIKDDRINYITKDDGGNFWMGTLHTGILKLEKQKNGSFVMCNYDARHGLSNPWVIKISINPKGEIFASTMGGIYKVQKFKDSVYIENLTTRYGGVSATWDFVQDAKGNFWLATPVGAVHVRNDLYKKPRAPKVIITRLFKNDQSDSSILITDTKKFRYNENNLGFEFSSASFRDESKVQYSYQLVNGNDSSQWSFPQKIHAVSLVSLSPGSYTFRIKAVTSENVWSNETTQYKFTIAPPFWNTWWFRGLMTLTLAALVYFLYRYRITQLKKLFAIRTKISRDLHDEIGSTLSGIGLISEIAKQQLENKKPVEVKESLDKISDNSEEMLSRMSDIVWAINPANDSFEKVINRLKAYAKNTADPLGINLHFNSEMDIERYNLDMQKRNNVYLICKEAINNAIKYSDCINLNFFVQQANHHINISIADDGKGFNIYQEYEGNGLKNMQSRAEEINADLKMSSENGKGTSIYLSIKIN
jgi:signal transduction histidine kinase/ligand-binding sensor domain-containing protein